MASSLLAAGLAMLLAAQAGPEERPNSVAPWSCNVRKSAQFKFSSAQARDTFEVSAVGSPCWEGILKIEIRTPKGKVLFRRETKLKALFDDEPPWDPALKADLESTVRSFFEEGFGKRTGDLSAYSKDEETEHIEISEEEYNRLREQNLPVFLIHGYESWQYYVYDPAAKKAKLIIQGGL